MIVLADSAIPRIRQSGQVGIMLGSVRVVSLWLTGCPIGLSLLSSV